MKRTWTRQIDGAVVYLFAKLVILLADVPALGCDHQSVPLPFDGLCNKEKDVCDNA